MALNFLNKKLEQWQDGVDKAFGQGRFAEQQPPPVVAGAATAQPPIASAVSVPAPATTHIAVGTPMPAEGTGVPVVQGVVQGVRTQ